MIADIIPEIKTRGQEEVFSYLVPEELQGKIDIGAIVSMPFGKRTIRGVVTGIRNQELGIKVHGEKYQLKEIKSLDSSFIIPNSYLEIAKWIAEYYLCSLGEAIELFLPPAIKNPRQKSEIRMTKSEKMLKIKK